jgi:hypothetical protein
MNSPTTVYGWSGEVAVYPIPNPIPDPLSTSDDSQHSPTKTSPKQSRGRPAGSIKLKRHVNSPGAPLHRKPRGASRSKDAAAKAPRPNRHRNKVASASGTPRNGVRAAKNTASPRAIQGRTSQHHNSLSAPQNLNCEAPAVQPVPAVQEVVCTHDFSIISMIEMRRLAAACLASAMHKSSEDPRFALHSASLQKVGAELEARALTQSALENSAWHT